MCDGRDGHGRSFEAIPGGPDVQQHSSAICAHVNIRALEIAVREVLPVQGLDAQQNVPNQPNQRFARSTGSERRTQRVWDVLVIQIHVVTRDRGVQQFGDVDRVRIRQTVHDHLHHRVVHG